MNTVLKNPCPELEHEYFQLELEFITNVSTETVRQSSRIIRPATAVEDINAPGRKCAQGVLQRTDLEKARELFEDWDFIYRTMQQNRILFACSQCRIYQFQSSTSTGTFVFGTVITDGSHNLVDYRARAQFADSQRAVLISLIRSMCTPESVSYRLESH